MTTATLKDETETQAAKTLAARIAGVAPQLAKKLTADNISEWTRTQREAVTNLLDSPPDSPDGIPAEAVKAMGQKAATNLVFSEIVKQRELLRCRESVIVEAEFQSAKLAAELGNLDGSLVVLREQRKEKSKEYAAAVLVLRRTIQDQQCGQKTLPFDEPPVAAGEEKGDTVSATTAASQPELIEIEFPPSYKHTASIRVRCLNESTWGASWKWSAEKGQNQGQSDVTIEGENRSDAICNAMGDLYQAMADVDYDPITEAGQNRRQDALDFIDKKIIEFERAAAGIEKGS